MDTDLDPYLEGFRPDWSRVKSCATRNIHTAQIPVPNGVLTLPDTETDTEGDKKKRGLCTIMWRFSHCTETDNTDLHWVLCTCSRYLSRSQSRSREM